MEWIFFSIFIVIFLFSLCIEGQMYVLGWSNYRLVIPFIDMYYFLPAKWSSLAVTLLHFSAFLFSSSSNLVSLYCTESSNELASTQAWCWWLRSQAGVEALTDAPCTSHTPSLSSWLKFAQPTSPLYHTRVLGFLVHVSRPLQLFWNVFLSNSSICGSRFLLSHNLCFQNWNIFSILKKL